jgi:uncharacterized membrane protein
MPLIASRDKRLEAFTDAAFAFAVTLLVVSVGSVPQNYADLISSMKAVPAFAMSFALICMFWNAHVRWSRRFDTGDWVSALLTLLLVFLVLIYVFPLRLMAIATMDFFFTGEMNAALGISTSEQGRWFFSLYGLGFLAMSSVFVLLFWHSLRKLVLEPDMRAELMSEIVIWSILTGTGLIATLIALFSPNPFLSSYTYMIIPVAIGIYYAIVGLRKKPRNLESSENA